MKRSRKSPSLFDLADDQTTAPPPPPGAAEGVALHEAAQSRYLNYALSVITSRALPDVRDGFKPVHRRILHGMNHDPLRPRKLLLHRKEISKLLGKTQQKGLTLVPLRIYFNPRGKAKIEIALAKGKKQYDRRETIKSREAGREVERAMKGVRRGG